MTYTQTVLPGLTHETLKELGVVSIGHRLKLLDAIAACAATRALRGASRRAGVVSYHFHLLPEFFGEDVLRDQRVDAAHDVHDLGHAEANGDAAQGISVELADLRLGREELDRAAGGERHRGIEVLVEADDDPVRIRFCDRPSQPLLLV